MHDVINTKSKLFKLYAARRVRVGEAWDVEDVIDEPVDICKYGRNVAAEIGRNVGINLLILLGGLLAAFMIATPVISSLLWLFTDNPWITFFGDLGTAMMMLDTIVVLLVGTGVIAWGVSVITTYLQNQFRARVRREVESKGSVGQTISWVKAMHGKYCIPLKFDRKSTNDHEEDDDLAVKWADDDDDDTEVYNRMEWPECPETDTGEDASTEIK